MAEKFESNIVTYTALLTHQQRLRRKDHNNPKELKGKVLGVREQKRNNDTQNGLILTISVDIDKKQAHGLLNKTVVISQEKHHVK